MLKIAKNSQTLDSNLTQRWRFVVSHRPYEGLKLRAGFHTGDVIAGVQVPNILSTFCTGFEILSTSISGVWHFYVLWHNCVLCPKICAWFSSYICWDQDGLLTFLLIYLKKFRYFSSVLGSRFSPIHITHISSVCWDQDASISAFWWDGQVCRASQLHRRGCVGSCLNSNELIHLIYPRKLAVSSKLTYLFNSSDETNIFFQQWRFTSVLRQRSSLIPSVATPWSPEASSWLM